MYYLQLTAADGSMSHIGPFHSDESRAAFQLKWGPIEALRFEYATPPPKTTSPTDYLVHVLGRYTYKEGEA